MNFFQRWFTPRNRYNVTYSRLFMGEQAEYVSIDQNEYQLYQEHSILRAVIDRKSSMYANGRFVHYDKNGNQIENSPIVDFLEKPNLAQSRNEWLMQMKVQECLYGNAFIYKLQPSRLKEYPNALWNLPPQRMIVNRTGKIWKQTDINGIIKNFELIGDLGANEKFETNEVLWRTLNNPDDPISGMSPLKSIAKEITNIALAMDYRNVIMAKKGALGILSNASKDSDGGIPLTNQERERLEKEYTRQYGVGDKQSSVIITNSALSWTPISYPTKDLLLFEEIDHNKRAIIDLYGLNDNIFSRQQGSTFTNVAEGEKLAYQNTIIPEAEDFARALTSFLGVDKNGEWLELTYDHVPALQEDLGTKAQSIKTLKETGLFTDEELREMI